MSHACALPPSGKPARAKGGVLDLSGWDLDRDGIVSLDGEWEFYWRRLLGPRDFRTGPPPRPDLYPHVPDSWRSYLLDGRALPPEGCATYRLLVRTGWPRGILAVRVREANHAHRLWANGALISDHGRVAAADQEMRYNNTPRTAYFAHAGGDIELVMQVSNYRDISCGILRSVKIGPSRAVDRDRNIGLSLDLFLTGSILIMGFYHIGLFLLRRKDPSALYFGLFCLVIALRTLLTEERAAYILFPGLGWNAALRVEFLTLLGAQLFALFVRSLYKDEFSRRVLMPFLALGAIYALVVIFMPAAAFFRALYPFQVVIAVGGGYIFYVLILAAARNREGAALILCGFLVIFMALINDILHSRMLIQTAYLIPSGLFIFIFLHSVILSMRFSRALSNAEGMAGKLERYANSLGEMVQERTRELNEERDRLKLRNDTIEEELAMARKIQQQLVPDASPVPYLHAIYKSMESVGGDFFDFIRFRDSRRLGIFISDVTGHGVPAALITSMIKSMILQAGSHRADPAEFLSYLNGLLVHRTGGNFVTAFYGVFDPDRRTITYSNAGHYPPYLADGDGVVTLEGGKASRWPFSTTRNWLPLIKATRTALMPCPPGAGSFSTPTACWSRGTAAGRPTSSSGR